MALQTGKKKTPVKKKAKLTPEQRAANKLKADHIRTTRTMFKNVGFDRVAELAEKDVDFLDQKGEFDDCFLYENVLLLVEYTTHKSGNVSDHLKHKKILFDRVHNNQAAFMTYLRNTFPAFATRFADAYNDNRMEIRVVYCSRHDFDEAVKKVVDTPVYLDYPLLKYFEKVAAAIKLSTLAEVLEFLTVDPADVGEGGVISKIDADAKYHGSILPEEASGFPKGYKVVSFYADAAALLQRAFVLRRKGWRGSQEAYQRMLIPSKVEAIRQGLKIKGQVAVNNIIATLPSDVLPIGPDNHTIKMENLIDTAPVKITLPLRSNSIGLIDGQHRLFSYYRTKDDDKAIAKLRRQQNLLVTGIIYPPGLDGSESERFEARLFLTINSNQSSAPSDLRQEIEVILNPCSPVAISKQVIERLAASGPLFGYVERYFYDKGKLKTSSIVNFGLVPLLKLSGTDSLFTIFEHADKNELSNGSTAALQPYIQLSVSKINEFLSAVRSVTKPERWTTDTKIADRLLTATFIIGFLITMRMLTERGIDINFDDIKTAMNGFNGFDLKPYSSSQYNRMAAAIMKQHFGIDVSAA